MLKIKDLLYEGLSDDLKPYYEKSDCCSLIVKLKKDKAEKQQEIERLNNIINQADNKNLELIQKINKIYDVIENKNITGIEARLLIQDMLDKEE